MDGKELAVWTGTCAKGTVHIDVCASAQAFKVFWGGEKQNSRTIPTNFANFEIEDSTAYRS
jgi:hypothetical protein